MNKLTHILDMDTFTEVNNDDERWTLSEMYGQQDYTEDELSDDEDEVELEEEGFRPDPLIRHLEEEAFKTECKKVLDFDTYVKKQYKKP